jgi:hypothetical protein
MENAVPPVPVGTASTSVRYELRAKAWAGTPADVGIARLEPGPNQGFFALFTVIGWVLLDLRRIRARHVEPAVTGEVDILGGSEAALLVWPGRFRTRKRLSGPVWR